MLFLEIVLLLRFFFCCLLNFNRVHLVFGKTGCRILIFFLCRKPPLGMLSNRCTAQYVSSLRMPVGEVTFLPCFSWAPHSCHCCVGVFWRVALLYNPVVCCCWQGKGDSALLEDFRLCVLPSLLYRCSCSSGKHYTRSFCLRSSLLALTAWGVGFREGSLLLSEHGLLFSWVTVPAGREKGQFVCIIQQNNKMMVVLPFYVSVGFMLSLTAYRPPSP